MRQPIYRTSIFVVIDLSYWPFFFLAILGAIVANATGAGGGVVFVPAFNMLGISSASIIATSFAIQCFGMSAGMLAWHKYASSQLTASVSHEQGTGVPANENIWSQYWPLIVLFSVPAVLGVLVGQYWFAIDDARVVKSVFKSFSILFGVSILLTTAYIVKTKRLDQSPMSFSQSLYLLTMVVSLIGGLVTAWLSIGVGELVAVMLILMRFPVRFAIGVAVSVSAICVWVGVQQHLWVAPNVDFNVLVFAAPAAVIGGTIAKRVTAFFSPIQLKVFIAAWILISAVAM